MSSNEGIFLIVFIGKENFAINTRSIESIHSLTSISFNKELNRCLAGFDMDWGKSVPILNPKESLNNEDGTSVIKNSSRVIFLSSNQAEGSVALIVDAISDIVNTSIEKENLKEFKRTNAIGKIQLPNKEVEIFEIRNVFMT